MTSLYERLGGEAALNAAVDLFYQKILADNQVSHFFDGTDMTKQHLKQKKFLAFAFGGPNKYDGIGLRKAHKKLVQDKGLSDNHFDLVINHLASTLEELGVAKSDIQEVAEVANSVRGDVLNR